MQKTPHRYITLIFSILNAKGEVWGVFVKIHF